MRDQYNREIDYMRVSVTDRCNLRCTYCMPAEGVTPLPHSEILRYDEIVRICRVAASIGISKIKLTGGEPLVRRNLPELIREIKALPGITDVTITTNGILLKEQADAIHQAGVDRINVSLDTLDPEEYRKITRGGDIREVLAGIDEALRYPDIMVKINCVPLTLKKETILSLAALAKDRPLHVRFIEIMPIGTGKEEEKPENTEERIRSIIEAEYGKTMEVSEKLGNGPSHYFELEGFCGKIGFISAVSHKFCDRCNRIRLTSDGFLKTCLQYDIGVDLKSLARGGATDEELKAAFVDAIARKPKEHAFNNEKVDHAERRCMSRIGG